MDELKDFFNLSVTFPKVTLQSGSVPTRRKPPSAEVVNSPSKRPALGTEYVHQYKLAEEQELLKADEARKSRHKNHSHIDDIQSEFGNSSMHTTDSVYMDTRYSFKREFPSLPIVEVRDKILKTVRDNRVVILEGATGCGKTTQVPQFILDEGYETGRKVNIIVTQPRRIAAMSIARRVGSERGLNEPDFKLPHIIGYHVGLANKTCEDTRITYVTTGVLLEKLITSKSLVDYTHIILDEVHERSQDMDFLFIVIRKLWATSKTVKMILMSATIEANPFSDYFKSLNDGPAPIIKVDRMNNFKVSEFFLCDLKSLNLKTTSVNANEPTIDSDMYNTALKLIYVANRIDVMDEEPFNQKPTILIFLPGMYEIGCMAKYIAESARSLEHNDFIVTALHSQISHDVQSEVLKKPALGKRLIILATNIAESSITVPDVKYVIDFCLTRVLVNDSATHFTSLQLEWCSRNNCRQRAGRTGRTMDGRVYRLVSKSFYYDEMNESSTPEILRSPLEKNVLKAKQLKMGSPESILALAMDQPKYSDIVNTLLVLKEAGALVRTCNKEFRDDDGDLTIIGHVMAALPVDFHVAKLVILGHCFGVLSECIIIAAGLTTKSIFVQSFKKGLVSYSKKLRYANGSGSDLLAVLNAYKSYEVRKNNNEDVRKWTDRHYLSERSIIEMSNLIEEITSRLESLGIAERTEENRVTWTSAQLSTILKVVIAGAFYPNYFVHSSNEMKDRDAYRELNGRNPCNTIYFSGFDEKFIRPLYVETIKRTLNQCTNLPENMQVTFDEEGSEKVYVTFKQTNASIASNIDMDLNLFESIPGEVCIEVYKALKLRKIGKPFTIDVMHPRDAMAYADQYKIGAWNRDKWVSNKKEIKNIDMVCLPRKHTEKVYGRITQYETEFNRFWFLPKEEENLFRDIGNELNNLNRDIVPFSNYNEVSIGQVVAAPYDSIYYRAKVLLILQEETQIFYRVIFIDIGSEDDIEFSDLRRLRGVSAQYIDIPPRVFECRLAYLQPSDLNSARHSWKSTMNQFKILTSKIRVCAEIFSVENGVASVKIICNNRIINNVLIKDGYARSADENYMSKVDHNMRVQKRSRSNEYDDDCDHVADEIRKMMGFEDECDVPEPKNSSRHINVTLNGPRCPLETQLFSSMPSAQTKAITIEPNSVNSIILTANPQDYFEKLLVAVNVTENKEGCTLTARETTTMPNIPGFGPLMALIFSPRCEFLLDEKYKSKFISIICGLGEHPQKKVPLYPDHDIVFNLDAEIDIADVENINSIRLCLDNLLKMDSNQRRVKIPEQEFTKEIKKKIFALLEKERFLIGVESSKKIGWSKYEQKDLCNAKDVHGTNAIFPLHNILTIAAEDSPPRLEQHVNLTENNNMLHRMKSTDVTLKRTVKCLLCNVDFERIPDLDLHLYSRCHAEREKRISLA